MKFGGALKATGFNIITYPVLTCLGSFFVLFLINLGIRYLVTQTPKYQDYLTGEGSWGMEISTKTDDGRKGIGPIQYFLVLDFLNAESAKRFWVAYDNRVKMVKGKEHVVS